MIRTKEKILAEMNDANTVLSTNPIIVNGLVVGSGNKAIDSFQPSNGKVLLISKKDGTLSTLNLDKPNVVIGIDSNGEIVLYDRSEIE